MIYTSGSTGEPKGVTLSHRNMTFVADSIIEYLELSAGGPDPLRPPALVQLRPLPAADGGPGRAPRWSSSPGFAFPGRIVSLLTDERITALPGVPTVFATLLSLHGLRERTFPDLRLLTNAGAALPEATVADAAANLPGGRALS